MSIAITTTIAEILSSILKIYVNATDAQKKVIEWRLSDEAAKYYTREENKKFYEDLANGDLAICDAIRLEKQQRIEQGLNEMNIKPTSNVISLLIITLGITWITGCASWFNPAIREIPANIHGNAVDVNSLKSTDKTYQIVETKAIEVSDGKKQTIVFNDNWFMVHKDWIKKFNENQNALLSLIESKKTGTNFIVVVHTNSPSL